MMLSAVGDRRRIDHLSGDLCRSTDLEGGPRAALRLVRGGA
jgi:hypothetical protein